MTKSLKPAILSLSLLTVMAGAAMAPALHVIQNYFRDVRSFYIQMIISIPALFIVLTSLVFPKLCQHFGAKTLVLFGLILYTVGGSIAGIFHQIGFVLCMRALVGIGVGILMPLSTGLLAFYFPPEQQEALMGYSSAANQMGGVIATLLSGMLANISWRISFLVYLLGLISIVLCLLAMPNDRIRTAEPKAETVPTFSTGQIWKENRFFVIAMFLLMSTFFIYPANFAMETAADGHISQTYVPFIMASMDFVAFIGGLLFVSCKRIFRKNTRFVAPILFFAGYLLLALVGGWVGTILGSVCIGFANGEGIPYMISTASRKMGKAAATTVMPMISAALYLAQFVSPMILSGVQVLMSSFSFPHLPYRLAAIFAFLFCLCSAKIQESSVPVERC